MYIYIYIYHYIIIFTFLLALAGDLAGHPLGPRFARSWKEASGDGYFGMMPMEYCERWEYHKPIDILMCIYIYCTYIYNIIIINYYYYIYIYIVAKKSRYQISSNVGKPGCHKPSIQGIGSQGLLHYLWLSQLGGKVGKPADMRYLYVIIIYIHIYIYIYHAENTFRNLFRVAIRSLVLTMHFCWLNMFF